ncbi:hypothetical protein B0O41_2416 [Propionibacteriaceae bacterium ES.041]|nr:hypothetical protein B0O41_2416 [Propionibacteriaceae bacterium ES.041]
MERVLSAPRVSVWVMDRLPLDSSDPVADEEIEVRRSARRRRTVSAYRSDGRIVVLLPARMSRSEEARWVREMVLKVQAREARTRGPQQPSELLTRALALQQRFLAPQLDQVRAPISVTWVANQNSRWGSCTPENATIRLSDRLRVMPAWVVDYVLLHELAHLAERDHGPRFWALLAAYPRTEEAKGYLAGWVDGRAAAGS